LRTLIVDEGQGPGGQIYRAITVSPHRDRSVLGDDYWAGSALADELKASGAEALYGATVWTLDRDLVVGVSAGGASRLLTAKRVVVATGALERPFPIPGWTLPGVMTAGAAQTLLKASGIVPNGRIVIAGVGPLLWLLAAQLLRAGADVAAILDTSSRSALLRAAPFAAGFLLSPYRAKGLALVGEVRRGARVVSGVTRLAALGDGRLAAVEIARGGEVERIEADHLLLHQGVVPNVNLAMAAGIEHRWHAERLCFEPVLGEGGRTTIPGIHIAGDGAGIGGALAAEARGRIAAAAIVGDLAPVARSQLPDVQVLRHDLARAERGRRFLDIMFKPARDFRIPTGDTIVCRCEEVTADEVRQSIENGAMGPNQLKAFRRTGMGPCQGRLCGLTVTEIIADARGITPAEAGYYRIRPPVKPIPLSEIADMPVTETATKAVVRG
jgi:NADPH-dependent 2,4-dienoyl-CoA reductase/sulfur reductase-like enzyme